MALWRNTVQHYFSGARVPVLICLVLGWKDASPLLAETLRLPPFVPLEMSVGEQSAPFGNALCWTRSNFLGASNERLDAPKKLERTCPN